MSEATWCAEFGLDVNAKALTKEMGSHTESGWELRMLLPRRHWGPVAKAIAKAERPHLKRLRLVNRAFDPGASPGRAMLSPKVTASLWAALPNLEELELVGHAWAPTLDHPTIRRLSMIGFGFTASFSKKPATAPKLEKLVWAFSGDEFGTAPGPSAFKGLWGASGLEALRQLDLGGADIDGNLLRAPSFLKSKLLPQLERLTLPVGSTEHEPFAKALPELAHLEVIGVCDQTLQELDERIAVVEEPTLPMPLTASGGNLHAFLVNDDNVTRFAAALTNHAAYPGVELSSHDVSERADVLGQALRTMPNLERLVLRQPHVYGLDEVGLRGLATELSGHPTLAELDLRGNRMTGAVEALADLVGGLPALRVLNLAKGKLDDHDLTALFAAAEAWTSLRALELGGNTKATAASALAALASAGLERLDVWGTSDLGGPIHGIGARLPALRELGLDRAKLSPEASLALVRSLTDVPSLRALEIGLSGDMTPAAEALAEHLPGLYRLKLDAASRWVVDAQHGGRLGAAVASLQTLETLELDDVDFTADGLAAFVEAVEDHPTLTELVGLDLDHKPDDEGADAMARALSATNIRSYSNLPSALARALLRADAVTDLHVTSRRNPSKIVPALPVADARNLQTLRITGGMLEPVVFDALADFCQLGITRLHLSGAADPQPLVAFLRSPKTAGVEVVPDIPVHVAIAEALKNRQN